MVLKIRAILVLARARRFPRSEFGVAASRTLHTTASRRSNLPPSDANDPFHHTTGRWLDRDKLQREARHVTFDFGALCAKAVDSCAGAKEVVRYEKKEGTFNRVFLFHLDNGACVVGRVPFRLAGPPRLTTNSEVATMAYVRSSTKIPVPKVLDWSDDASAIGTEYILMEHALGTQLHQKWESMSSHQHMLCVKNITHMMVEMAKLPLPAYGSLYFADAPIDPSLKSKFVEGFCIGPHCGRGYWNCDLENSRHYKEETMDRGPWNNLLSYCSGLTNAGFSYISKLEPSGSDPSYCLSVQEHRRLLDTSNAVVPELARSPILQSVADPVLLHPDMHKRNIFVSEEDPTRVTAIIDWQSTSIEPTFVHAEYTPDFILDYTAAIEMIENVIHQEAETTNAELPPDGTLMDPETLKRHKIDASICKQTFEVVLQGYSQKLHKVRTMDKALLRSIYDHKGLIRSAVSLRQQFIELSERWKKLGFAGECPYQPNGDEVSEHVKKYRDFEAFQQLSWLLRRMLNVDSDGWVSADEWETALKDNTELFNQWMKVTVDDGESKEHGIAFWPFGEVGTLTKDDEVAKESG